jgi:hypothetical protein
MSLPRRSGGFVAAALLLLASSPAGHRAAPAPKKGIVVPRAGTDPFRTKGDITSLALTPDGKTIFAGAGNNRVFALDVLTGKQVHAWEAARRSRCWPSR